MIDDFEQMAEEIEDELDEVIVDDGTAERTINKIRAIESDYQRLIAVCKEQIDRYQTKIDAYNLRIKNDTEYYYYRLKDFFASRDNKRELKTKTVYKLPSGTITLTYGKTKVDYDEKTLTAWLRDNGYDEYIKTREVEGVKWAELKEKLAFAGESAVMGEDGSIVDGVTVKEIADKIDFKLTE